MKPYLVVLRGRSVSGHFIDHTVFVVAQNSKDALKQGQNVIDGFAPIQAQEAKKEEFDAWAKRIKTEYSRVVELETKLSIGI